MSNPLKSLYDILRQYGCDLDPRLMADIKQWQKDNIQVLTISKTISVDTWFIGQRSEIIKYVKRDLAQQLANELLENIPIERHTEPEQHPFGRSADTYTAKVLIIETEVKEIFEENDLKSIYQLEQE